MLLDKERLELGLGQDRRRNTKSGEETRSNIIRVVYLILMMDTNMVCKLMFTRLLDTIVKGVSHDGKIIGIE